MPDQMPEGLAFCVPNRVIYIIYYILIDYQYTIVC
nr:MAG TPA: hypothetical protein [Caudoviricetes sp.]